MFFSYSLRSVLVSITCGSLVCATTFAVDLDLTIRGATGALGAGAFQQADPQPTGTGFIDPFVRLQANGEERGFNTDASRLIGDLADVKQGHWTHSLRVSRLTPVVREGVLSVQFLLDINQSGSRPLLSMDALRVFTAARADLDTEAALFAEHLVYDLGAGNRVLLDASLNSGSGSGDLFFWLPASLFTGLGDQYLYLYSEFGASGGNYASNGGFEEWAQVSFPVSIERATWAGVKRLYD